MKQPSWISPMLATLVDAPFSDKNWIFEKKFDGIRCLVFRSGSRLVLYSRNRKRLDRTYPALQKAFLKQKNTDFIVDGEIVAISRGKDSFSALQMAKRKVVKIAFCAFDLLYDRGEDLRKFSLIERKKRLKKALSYGKEILYTAHILEKGERYFQQGVRKGWEGVIAKRADSNYVSKRSRDWQKFKAVKSQEFVICGYTPPQGSRIGFGALLIGYYEKGLFRFAGKVGTGYNEDLLRALTKKLKGISSKKSPFQEEVKNAHWVRPKLVAQIGFTEWTRDGKLRHPRFLGLRTDKSPRECFK